MIYTFYLATGQAPMSSPVIEMMGVHIFNEICIILYIREHTKALVCPCSLMSLIVLDGFGLLHGLKPLGHAGVII